MNMSATGERIRGLIAQEAADWFVAHRGALGARERERFAAWLRASPVHVEEYLGIAGIARDLPGACGLPQPQLDEIIARARQDEQVVHSAWPRAWAALRAVPAVRLQVAAAAVLLGAVALAAAGWWHLRGATTVVPAVVSAVQQFQTGHGGQMTQRLADGSVVYLNTDSAVMVEYRERERRVTLKSGEAVFEVAHDRVRPFRVFAGHAQVVAVGTRFDVRLQEDATTVTVAEGRVEVGPSAPAPQAIAALPAGSAAIVQVGAEQQVRYAPEAWPVAPERADPGHTTAWLHRQITFEHEPLGRVASEFNRYSAKTIEIATPALRNLQISGAFATDDTEAFIAFLRSLEGVKVEVTETRIRVSQRPTAPVH